jgi:hypothetical protein
VKKIIAFALAGISVTSISYAENRLFPTDILNAGEFDANASVEFQSLSYDVRFAGNPGSRSVDISRESVGARYGLGANWHIGASINYDSRHVVRTDFSAPPAHFVNRDSEGTNNPYLWASYGFINDKANPLSLSGQLFVAPNTTHAPSTYGGKLAAGWVSSKTLRFFGVYAKEIASDSGVADKDSISIGAYKDISSTITLVPSARYQRFSSTDTFSSVKQLSVSLAAHVQVSGNTYLIPSITNYRNSSGHSKDGLFQMDSTGNGTAVQLSLYHLF